MLNNKNLNQNTNKQTAAFSRAAATPACAASTTCCTSTSDNNSTTATTAVWFDPFYVQQTSKSIEFDSIDNFMPDSPSGMDTSAFAATDPHPYLYQQQQQQQQKFIGLQRARNNSIANNNNNNNNSNGNTNYNTVSNAHRKIVTIDNDDELNGNDITMTTTLPMESRIKFRITENPMNAV